MFQKFAFTLFSISCVGLLSLSACQTAPQGSLQFQVMLPAQATHFQIQAIPENTNRLRIEISGTGLTSPSITTLTASANETRYQQSIALPVGEKTIRVQALENDTVLATGRGTVTIAANQQTRLNLTLTPLETEPQDALQITLAGIVPAAVPLSLHISGEGLTQPLERTLTLPAGISPTALLAEALPPGEKRLEIRVDLANGLGEKLPTIVENFTVNETGGAALELSLETLVMRYRHELAHIPEIMDLLRRYAPHLLLLLNQPEPAPSATASPSSNTGSGQIRLGEVIPSKDHAP